MPAPAVYILAVVGTVAAGVAFKEFVYEPHIAPRIEQWAENFLAKRRERQRARSHSPVAAHAGTDEQHTHTRYDDEGYAYDERTDIELERLVAKEVDNWRTGVASSSAVGVAGGLRLRDRQSERRTSSSSSVPKWAPLSPSQIIFDTRSPPSPTTQRNSPRLPTPAPSESARAHHIHARSSTPADANDPFDIGVDVESVSTSSRANSVSSSAIIPSLSSHYLSARPASASSDLDFMSLSDASSNHDDVRSVRSLTLTRTPSGSSLSSWTSGGVRSNN